MIKSLLAIVIGLVFNVAVASPVYTPETPVHVDGYTKKDGTHVESYWRARPGQKQDELGSSSYSSDTSGSYSDDSYAGSDGFDYKSSNKAENDYNDSTNQMGSDSNPNPTEQDQSYSQLNMNSPANTLSQNDSLDGSDSNNNFGG